MIYWLQPARARINTNTMNTTQVTSTGIAVAIAVAIALGLLFFGPHIFSPFQAPGAQTNATTTDMAASTTAQTTMNPETTNSAVIPNPLPTTLTGSDTVVGTGAEAVAG